MKTIAVYGSLKKGKYNHELLKNAKFLGEAHIAGTLYSLGSYPALVEGNHELYEVEIYEVSDEDVEFVDMVEKGAGYIEKVEQFVVDGQLIEATVYYAGKSLAEYCEKNKQVISNY